MQFDSGLVYVVLGSLLSINAALLGWILNTLVNLRGRMHRLEARESFVSSGLEHLGERLDALAEHLMPNGSARRKG